SATTDSFASFSHDPPRLLPMPMPSSFPPNTPPLQHSITPRRSRLPPSAPGPHHSTTPSLRGAPAYPSAPGTARDPLFFTLHSSLFTPLPPQSPHADTRRAPARPRLSPAGLR